MKDRGKYTRLLFRTAFAWNIAVAVGFALLAELAPTSLDAFVRQVPESMAFAHLTMLFILLFGIAFLFVSLDFDGNRDIVRLGVIEKASLFLVVLVYSVSGDLKLPLFLAACVDLIFGLLFLETLRASKRASPSRG